MDGLLPKKILARCTARARRALWLALVANGTEAGPGDLLVSIANERGSVGANLLAAHDFGQEIFGQVSSSQESRAETRGAVIERKITLSPSLKRTLKKSVRLAADHDSRHIGTEHFLAALLEEESIRKILNLNHKDDNDRVENLQDELVSLLAHTARLSKLSAAAEPLADGLRSWLESREQSFPPPEEKDDPAGRPRKSNLPARPAGEPAAFKKQKPRHEPRALDYFTEDLTNRAARGELDPLIGRNEEVERVVSILSRRSKNNPILIGEAGVGKTAIVHGLAQRICESAVPEHLRERRLLALDLGLLIAGTVFRGEFEGRLKDVIGEAEKERAILFIDEVHTVVGAGAAQGSLDAANILKPAIVRGSFQIIGATTTEEYRKSIERDSALERRFQPVLISEPPAKETLKILKGLKKEFEKYHRLAIPDETLERTVWLAERYLPSRSFPDKAIDVLDEAAASLRARGVSRRPSRRLLLREELRRARQEKEQALRAERYEEALRLNDKEKSLSRQLRATPEFSGLAEIESSSILWPIEAERAVSRMTGIALSRISRSEKHKLLNLEKRLKKHIVGQDQAVTAVAAALRRARSGIKDSFRPIGSFLFIGPSGVGKSEFAKVLAHIFFEDPRSFFRLDMSEFAESHAVSKLLGAPAGYVGYEDAGAFIEFVRRRPYSLLLFDEIEKAHPYVQNVLLQILEDGELTDARGTKASFRHCLIILTANTVRALGEESRGLGFEARPAAAGGDEEEVYRYLRPELVSRLDEVIVFQSLKKRDVERVVGIEIAKLRQRLAAQKIRLDYTQAVLRHLAGLSESHRHGARRVRSQIQKLVEEPLAQKIIAGELKDRSKIILAAGGGKLKWRVLKN